MVFSWDINNGHAVSSRTYNFRKNIKKFDWKDGKNM
jgi:hypothetical protein